MRIVGFAQTLRFSRRHTQRFRRDRNILKSFLNNGYQIDHEDSSREIVTIRRKDGKS